MKVYCTKCGNAIHIYFNFCPYCGSLGAQRTIPASIKKETIKNGYFCHSCREVNYREALFCAYCGVDLFNYSGGETIFCPICGEKNPSSSKFCLNCDFLLTDWFLMKGKIAEAVGYSGNLTIHDNFIGMAYEFINDDVVTIGRHSSNTITLNCNLVSRKHCVFEIREKRIRDLGSRNSTFINRLNEPIKSVRFEDIAELNIAGTFTFIVTKSSWFMAIKLIEILKDSACDCYYSDIGKSLYQHYFIFPLDNGDINIRKVNGAIVQKIDPDDDYLTISFEEGKYYLTDHERGLERYLIRKSFNQLPSNLKIVFGRG